MKNLSARHGYSKVALICFGIFLLIGATTFFSIRPDLSRKERMRNYLRKNSIILAQIVDESKGLWIDGRDMTNELMKESFSESMRTAFRSGELSYIEGRSDDGVVTFAFQWSHIPEGSIDLVYNPANIYSLDADDRRIVTLVSEAENTWHWTGLGINGEGYIIVERLQDKWFYDETYRPT